MTSDQELAQRCCDAAQKYQQVCHMIALEALIGWGLTTAYVCGTTVLSMTDNDPWWLIVVLVVCTGVLASRTMALFSLRRALRG